MSLHYLVKLKVLFAYVLPLSCKRNSRIYSIRFEYSWLQGAENTAREVVQNTHHWSGRTETATENGVGQAGSCHHCRSPSSVVSLIDPDLISDACFVHILSQYSHKL